MSHYGTMRLRLVVAGAALALAGCVATTPERGGQVATTATRAPAVSGSVSESGTQRVFEAKGIAYLGGDFSETREEAYNESKKRLFDAGADIHLSAIQATTFGTLTTDCAMQVVSGTLRDFKVLEEGIENQSRYFVRSQARFEQREAEKALGKEALKKIGCWGGEEETAGEMNETPAPVVSDVATAEGSATVKSDSRASATSGTPVSTSEAPVPTDLVLVTKKDHRGRVDVEVEKLPRHVAPAEETTVCCHEFPDVLSRRVRPVLEQIPGVTRLQRLHTSDGSLCYRFHYRGQSAVLEDRLERDLRTSSTLSFRLERKRGTNLVDLVFDGGFD